MGLVDIIEELTATQIQKTETGDNRIFGVVVGSVLSNYDKDVKRVGQVKVKIDLYQESTAMVKWARVAFPYGAGAYGHYFLPEVGDQVLLMFEGGLIDRPYVVGVVPKDADQIISDSTVYTENNYIKKIRTKGDNQILFDDTPKEQHIIISDVKNKNKIDLITAKDEGKGSLTIKVEEQLIIEVGSNIKITLDANTGNITINKGNNLTATSLKQLNIKTTESATIEGQQSAAIKSSGPAKVEGSSVATK